MMKIVQSAILSAFVLMSLFTGAFAASYNITYLNTPVGFKSPKPTAINASGLIAGTAQDNLGHTHAFIWEHDGSVRELPMPAGYISCGIHDMNALGQCVGYATDESDNGHAIVWDEDGIPRDLGALDGVYSIARSINIHGQIAGWSGSPGGSIHAMLWDTSGSYTDLGQTQGWLWSRADGVNDSGQVVGGGPGGAFMLSGNALTDLGARIDDIAHNSEACAVNNSGDVVGWQTGVGGEAVLWRSDGTVVTLNTPSEFSMNYVWSINSNTLIAGWSTQISAPLLIKHAVVWDSTGQIKDINPAGMISSHAYDINDNGWIVGDCSNDTTSYAVVWTPVPEPSCILAILCGVMGSGIFVWRQKR